MNIPYVMKKCSKCGRWLVANTVNFYKHKTNKDGLGGKCKECASKYGKQYREANREKITKKNKQYYQNNREKELERQKQYRQDNKEKITKKNKQWYEVNRDEILERHKQWYEANREKDLERHKQWYEANREKIAEQHKQYYEDNKDKVCESIKRYRQTPQGQAVRFNSNNKRRHKKTTQGTGVTPDQWLEMMQYFDWICAYTGERLTDKTRSIDHIVPIDAGGDDMVWNMVPMLRNLNSSKRAKNMLEWYREQDFYDPKRLQKIYEWQEYAYNKWGKDTEYFNTNDIQITLL